MSKIKDKNGNIQWDQVKINPPIVSTWGKKNNVAIATVIDIINREEKICQEIIDAINNNTTVSPTWKLEQKLYYRGQLHMCKTLKYYISLKD